PQHRQYYIAETVFYRECKITKNKVMVFYNMVQIIFDFFIFFVN
ncbi:hypothetical protein T07_2285, partial [Trichinella nelsoni]